MGLLDWMLKSYSSGYFSVKLLQFSVGMTFPKMRLQSATKLLRLLYSNRVTTDNKRMHTHSPLPTLLHSKLWCLLFSRGSSNSSTTLHEGDGGVKALFPPLEVSKASESPFKAKCLNWRNASLVNANFSVNQMCPIICRWKLVKHQIGRASCRERV